MTVTQRSARIFDNADQPWSDRARNITPAPYFRWSGLLCRIVAALLLLPAMPLMAGLVALTRLTSRGPGIYRQVRAGKHGRPFTMLKIRTMVHDAERDTGPVWARDNDARITRFGRVLRKMHLDELPQLFNVLKGEMALLGPRPERPEIAHQLAQQIPAYLNRLAVLPGISGLAQINLPPDTTLDDVRRKLILDLEYIRHGRVMLDVRMFVYSVLRLMMLPESPTMQLMRVHRAVAVPEAMFAAAPPFPLASHGSGAHEENGNGHGNARGSHRNHADSTARPTEAIAARSHLDASGG